MCGIAFLLQPLTAEPMDLTSFCLRAMESLQHRGLDGCGLAYSDTQRLWSDKQREMLVASFFSRQSFLAEFRRHQPRKVLGHIRYSTAGDADSIANYQPHYLDSIGGRIALASNGDLPDLKAEKSALEAQGVAFYSDNDAELILKKIEHTKVTQSLKYADSIRRFMETTRGSYSAVLMTPAETFVFRDPYENRPLWYGRAGELTVVASETCTFDILGGEPEREVSGGEILRIDNHGRTESRVGDVRSPRQHCIFEETYFARPDSDIFGNEEVSDFRQFVGQRLWTEYPVEADVVSPIPNSGNEASFAFALASGIWHYPILIRNQTLPRTFIMPNQELREDAARRKYGVKKAIFRRARRENRRLRIVLLDDSIVRGTTTRQVVNMVRKAGAAEVHLRIGFPPVTHPCVYGIAMPTKAELIATSKSVEEIRKFLGVDSLGYLSREGLRWCIEQSGQQPNDFCSACYTGQYVI